MSTLTIRIAEHAGTCYGVERALNMAHDAGSAAAETHDSVRTLGPLIHNPIVVSELANLGVSSVDSLDQIESGTVIVRAHGVIPQVIEQAHERDLTVKDATCPYVKKVQMAAEKLARNGYQVLVVGEAGHPEVEGIMGHAGSNAFVVNGPEALDGIDLAPKVGVVVQTTQTVKNLGAVVERLLASVSELKVVNTICSATSERQQAAEQLASQVDVMVVIGGKNSGNTRRLAEICRSGCTRVHHIEQASELSVGDFAPNDTVGITAGASTPQSHIDRVVETLTAMDI